MEVHGTALISTLAIALSAAFVAGYVARRIGLPAIVGYLLAGVAVGPFTPGLTADPHIALQLAEIGVALLMFGVGLHFSIGDLWSVRRIAIPGALGQIVVATGLGTAAGLMFGWGPPCIRGSRCRRIGREHGRADPRARPSRDDDIPAGPRRDRLADRRGPRHGPRAGDLAGARPERRRIERCGRGG